MDTIVMGPQGSGKGTHAARAAKDLALSYFEMSGELKSFLNSGTPEAAEALRMKNAGMLIPTSSVSGVVRGFKSRAGRPVLWDGFPRTIDQKSIAEEVTRGEFGVVYLTLTREQAMERIAQRAAEAGANARKDDQDPEAVKLRLATFEAETLPVIDAWKREGRPVHVISTVGDKESNYAKVSEAIRSILGKTIRRAEGVLGYAV